MRTRNLKLSARLGIAFALMTLLSVVVGVFGAWRLQALNGTVVTVVDESLPEMRALAGVRYTINAVRLAESDVLMSTSSSDVEGLAAKVQERYGNFRDRVNELQRFIKSDAEKAAFAAFEASEKAYRADMDKQIALAKQGPRGVAEARLLYRGASRTHFDAMLEQIVRLIDLGTAAGQEDAARARAAYTIALQGMGVIGAGALIAAVVLSVWILRSVTRQLGGEPEEAAALARRVADGDLTAHIEVRNGDAASLLAALKRMQDSLSSIVNGVRNNADGVAIASAQIAQGNNDLSSRTEQQASAIQQTAASMRQLAETVRQNADHAQQGNRLASEASGVAARGGAVVGQVVETMKGINDSSRRIADIISVIDGIAFQTNILALNAAVEAARAGEQGRGFAVVAGEVRTLAQRSADAAKEIKDLITASVDRVQAGSALVDQAGATMSEVVQAIKRVNDLMGEISAASQEQSTGVAQIGEAVSQMDRTTQQNAALVEQSAAAAASLKSQAQQLVGAVGIFRTSSQPAANMDAIATAAALPAPVAPAPAAAAPVTALSPKATSTAGAKTEEARTGTDDWQTF